MRAALIQALGEPPGVHDAPEPARGEGQALIDVGAAPLNPIDLAIASGGFYAGRPEVPYVPGKEGVGTVVEGDSLSPGTRVYFRMPGGLGGSAGALAERVAAAEAEAIELAGGVDDALAACFGTAGLAAWLATEWRARLAPGETVLVLAASGAVGQIAVQAAKLLGAGRVVAAARDAHGLARARELGADAVVNLGGADGVDDLAEAFRAAAGGAVDVTIDPLWGEPGTAAVHAAAEFGRIVQLGQSAGAEATLPSALLRGNSLSILGHTNVAAPREVTAAAYRRMVEEAAAGRLTVDHEVIELERAGEAWRRQADFPHRKLVLRP